ncbi:hypothetical protein [Aeoliella sp.]|uniref:hypothetical protein n=1 Tax=Aeoliella sp. TaxID=2795800 RepID=UPI003CCC0748
MDLTKIALGLLTAFCLLDTGDLALAKSPSEDVQDIRSDFVSEATKARAEYRRELQKAAKRAVSDYEKAAASAVRAGDLAAATNAMRQILLLDRDHKKAQSHFEAIGQLDEVLKELEDEPVLPEGDEPVNTGKLARSLVGTTWTWGDKRTITFAGGGRATVSTDSQPNTRLWKVGSDGSVHIGSPPSHPWYVVIKFDNNLRAFAGHSLKLESSNFRGQRTR